MAENRIKIKIDAEGNATVKLDDLVGSVGKAQSSFMSLKGVLSGVASAFAVKEFVEITDKFKNINTQLKLAIGNNGDLEKTQAALFKMSQSLNSEYGATAVFNSGLAKSSESLGLSQDKLLQVTENVSKAVALSGSSASSAEAALMQFGQALASGTLRGDELNSILEQTPALARTIADGMKVTVGELRKLGAEGKITSDALAKAILSQTDALEKQMGQREKTIGGALTSMGNSVGAFINELDKLSGVSSGTTDTLKWVSDQIDVFTAAIKQNAKNIQAIFADVWLDVKGFFLKMEMLMKNMPTFSIENLVGGKFFVEIEKLEQMFKAVDQAMANIRARRVPLPGGGSGAGGGAGGGAGSADLLNNLIAQKEVMAKDFDSLDKFFLDMDEEVNSRQNLIADSFNSLDKFFLDMDEEADKAAKNKATAIGGLGNSIIKNLADQPNPGTAAMGVLKQAGGQIAGVGGAMQGFAAGGPWGALIGAAGELILSNDKMQEALGRISETLIELLEPIVDSLIPTLEAIVPLIQALKPLLEFMGRVETAMLEPARLIVVNLVGLINSLVNFGNQFSGSTKAMGDDMAEFNTNFNDALHSLFGPLMEAIWSLIQALRPDKNKNIGINTDQFKGGSKEEVLRYVAKKAFGFAEGGLITPDRMMRWPGMEPGAGFIKAHVGERVVPVGGSGNAVNLTFNVSAMDPRGSAEAIRQTVEELFLSGRLRVA